MGKSLKEREELFRKLFLQSLNDAASNWTSTFTHEDNDSSPDNSSSRILEEIEYNRATASLGTNFAKAFTALGLITLCINVGILSIILSHTRRHVLRQVFYLLIINFAIIDCLKGVCLASHALRFIVPPSVYDDRKVLATRIDQFVVIFFRLFNLATIFNLLMITLNEFIYIKFPLRYHQWLRRRTILCLLCLSWIISIAFTVASSLAKAKEDTVFVSLNDLNGTKGDVQMVSYDSRRNLLRTGITSGSPDLHTLFTFALTGFCVFSLLVVLVCYAIFFNVIRNIQKYDRQLYLDANLRRTSEASVECGDMQHLDERKIKRQLLKRYKYVLVIGSVILVYLLYLISYCTIQILQYFNLSRAGMNSEKMRTMLITRWILVLLCGLHSTIQPICYFRMREFRGIVSRVCGYKCARVGHRPRHCDTERWSEHVNSLPEVIPITAHHHHHTPVRYTGSSTSRNSTHFIVNNHTHQVNGVQAKIPSALVRHKTTTSTDHHPQMNGARSVGRRQSVVHFEQGSPLVSTLARRESGFSSENNIL